MISNEKFKNYIQSANINFLIGSGLSRPYLSTLGNIESYLTELNESKVDEKLKIIIEASLYKMYFDDVIYPNHPEMIDKDELIGYYESTIEQYSKFLNIWNEIIARRCSNILNKQINVFSTNIDLFMERAAEQTRVEFNDGFRGRISPKFDEGNFLKSYSKVSSHYQNTSEVPVFNLFKIHGSIDWNSDDNNIDVSCDSKLDLVSHIMDVLNKIDKKWFIKIADDKATIDSLEKKAKAIIYDNEDFTKEIFKEFFDEYDKLVIVNPTKRKFKETVLDLHFYELMRMLSNAMEKENSILFVQGFSFADEHIAKIALRAADTNPTLIILVFAHKSDEVSGYWDKLKLSDGKSKNNNIWIVSPDEYIKANSEGKDDEQIVKLKELFKAFDFRTINLAYESIGKMIPIRSYGK
jgi:hypothetical protein